MSAKQIGSALEWLRHLVGGLENENESELLEKYVRDHDARAFEELAKRHAPMVMSVCRRILGNHADAEDAFQAVLIVLAQKAGTISPPSHLSRWIVGVARRVALKARANRNRRFAHEVSCASPPEIGASKSSQLDLEEMLTDSLALLPEHYRLVVVLCDLQGMQLNEAATALGCPQGTVASRLARGRSLLRSRLRSQGALLSTVALVALLQSQQSFASVPLRLIRGVCALMGQRGNPLSSGEMSMSPEIAALVDQAVLPSAKKYLARGALAVLTALVGVVTIYIAVRFLSDTQVRPAPAPHSITGQPALHTITWEERSFRALFRLTLWEDGKYRLEKWNRAPKVKKRIEHNGEKPSLIAEDIELQFTVGKRSQVTTGVWKVISSSHQLIVLEGEGAQGIRLYRQSDRGTKWRFDFVSVFNRDKLPDNLKDTWVKVGKRWFAYREDLATHSQEQSIAPLLGKEKDERKVPSRIEPGLQKKIRQTLPRGWTATVIGDVLVIGRDSKLLLELLTPPSSSERDRSSEPLEDYRTDRYVVELRFHPRMSIEQYRKRVSENRLTQQRIKRLGPDLQKFFGKGGYEPRTASQRAVLKKYRELKSALHRLPDFYCKSSSITMEDNLWSRATFGTIKLQKECRAIVARLRSVLHTYPSD